MDIKNLPPEIQDEFKKNFPELVSTETSYTIIPESPILPEVELVNPLDEPFIEDAVVVEEPTPVPQEVVSEVTEEVAVFESNLISPDVDFLEAVFNLEENSETGEADLSEENGERPDEIKMNYNRFKGADWFKTVQQQDIVLAGLGGIGSYVSFYLSRLGPNTLYLFDDDLFEHHNMSGQFVSKDDIGIHKVLAAQRHAEKFSDYTPQIFPIRFTSTECLADKIMICGFDNMQARKDFYYAWKSHIIKGLEHEHLFIDGRLLAEEFQIIVITGDDDFYQNVYERDFLFDDKDVAEVDCTLKQTSHMAGMIASYMVTYFINFCNNLSPDNFPRRLPFFTHYNSLMNTYEHRY